MGASSRRAKVPGAIPVAALNVPAPGKQRGEKNREIERTN